ncbi:MAG: helix-turn-helix domain-containing protein [Ruminococcaceae bacterium]|nr:helix-turn-helix domain-containing protein [Oscillospiraceae bacterium]
MNFEELIIAAQNGSDEAMTEILEMYMPLIDKHSRIDGVLDEDLRQIILMKIIKNIGKFKVK